MATRKHRRTMSEINVVPYIDVMLVLLVIFMVTAPLLAQGVKVDLPQAEAEPVRDTSLPPLVVTVEQDGAYHVEHGTTLTRDLAAEEVAIRVAAVLRLAPGTPVYVNGDREVAYGKVVRVMALMKQAGAPSVGLLTEPPGQ
jgi:biopolymer transport protein TolR